MSLLTVEQVGAPEFEAQSTSIDDPLSADYVGDYGLIKFAPHATITTAIEFNVGPALQSNLNLLPLPEQQDGSVRAEAVALTLEAQHNVETENGTQFRFEYEYTALGPTTEPVFPSTADIYSWSPHTESMELSVAQDYLEYAHPQKLDSLQAYECLAQPTGDSTYEWTATVSLTLEDNTYGLLRGYDHYSVLKDKISYHWGMGPN